MAQDWAEVTAKKVAGRIAEEAERATTLQKRYGDGVERFRRQVLDLVVAVNAHIETEMNHIHVITLDNGIILAAAYKRIVTTEEMGREEGVPACVGSVRIQREDRKATAALEPARVFLTSAGVQTAFYHRNKDLKMMIFAEAEFKQLIEYFAS